MESTGFIRKIDKLGRIALPSEVRKKHDVMPKDDMEMFTEDSYIVLKKYEVSCLFCDNKEDLIFFKGKYICKNCLKNIKALK